MPGMILETLELLFRRKNWVEIRYRRRECYVLVWNQHRGHYVIVWSGGDCDASSKIGLADQLGFRCFSGKEDKLLDSGRVSSYTRDPIVCCFNPHSSPHPRRDAGCVHVRPNIVAPISASHAYTIAARLACAQSWLGCIDFLSLSAAARLIDSVYS